MGVRGGACPATRLVCGCSPASVGLYGDVRIRIYHSKITGQWRRCFVYTPPDYDSGPSSRYPVLYLQHGSGMGSPKQLTREQVEALKKVSSGEPSSQSEVSVTGGQFTKTLPMRTNDCFEVVLTPVKSKH